MMTNMRKTQLSGAILSALALGSGCSNESTGDSTDFKGEEACEVFTVPEPPEPPEPPGPVVTNDPIIDADSLSTGIAFDFAVRIADSLPVIAADGNLIFPNISVTDNSIQTLFFSGDVPEDKRIAAIFIGLNGVDEYFAIPIAREMGTGAVSETPLEITLRGPVPIEGTDPEPDIIQTQITNNMSVRAYLVNANASTPNLSGDLSAIFASDASNWLAPGTTPQMTAENVGSGKLQVTLFWNKENDIDLWLIEPDGNKIYYAAPNSIAGDGFLDFDNTVAYGPENIFFTDNVPAGQYQVQVHYFSGSPVTNWSVSVSACGSTGTFSGSLAAADEIDDVFTFDFGPDCTLDLPPPPPPPPPPEDPRSSPTIFDEAVICNE